VTEATELIVARAQSFSGMNDETARQSLDRA
jgi:hypothetical protein